jgi:hypothetical protein
MHTKVWSESQKRKQGIDGSPEPVPKTGKADHA